MPKIDTQLEELKRTLRRRLERNNERKKDMEARYRGQEASLNLPWGFNLGYLVGKVSEIEEMLDWLEEIK